MLQLVYKFFQGYIKIASDTDNRLYREDNRISISINLRVTIPKTWDRFFYAFL